MFKKGDKVYCEAGGYIHSKTSNVYGFTIPGNIEDFEDVRLTKPYILEVVNNVIFLENRKFMIIPKSLDYADIKTKIITSRYSNDDQMAIILNKDSSEEDTVLYNKMQEWREFAGEIAKAASNM
jgi:hypothetical protein